MIKKAKKSEIISKFKTNEKDTGSAQVQIALLSKSIDEMLNHLKKHAKDLHSKRGLLGMVVKRRKLLTYLKRKSEPKFLKIKKQVGLK